MGRESRNCPARAVPTRGSTGARARGKGAEGGQPGDVESSAPSPALSKCALSDGDGGGGRELVGGEGGDAGGGVVARKINDGRGILGQCSLDRRPCLRSILVARRPPSSSSSVRRRRDASLPLFLLLYPPLGDESGTWRRAVDDRKRVRPSVAR